jgi:hypothetical protein
MTRRTTLHTLAAGCLLAAAASAPAAPIELYEQPQFKGMALGLDRANAHLADYGFDNKALSVIVRSGSWELCTDNEFRGSCLTLVAGQHATLPPAMQRSLSSVRPKGGVVPLPGTGAATGSLAGSMASSMAGAGGDAGAAVVLYDDGDFSGKSLAVNGPVPSLGKLGMGDRVSSVDIRRGRWQLCHDSGYTGSCIVLEPGRHPLTGGMHDEASSIRQVYGASNQPLPATGGLTLYENGDFSGRTLFITGATEYLGRQGFNDTASAVEVLDGLWDICTDSVFRGNCITLGPGRHVLTGGNHDRASSVRPRVPDNSPAWRGADPQRRILF